MISSGFSNYTTLPVEKKKKNSDNDCGMREARSSWSAEEQFVWVSEQRWAQALTQAGAWGSFWGWQGHGVRREGWMGCHSDVVWGVYTVLFCTVPDKRWPTWQKRANVFGSGAKTVWEVQRWLLSVFSTKDGLGQNSVLEICCIAVIAFVLHDFYSTGATLLFVQHLM